MPRFSIPGPTESSFQQPLAWSHRGGGDCAQPCPNGTRIFWRPLTCPRRLEGERCDGFQKTSKVVKKKLIDVDDDDDDDDDVGDSDRDGQGEKTVRLQGQLLRCSTCR